MKLIINLQLDVGSLDEFYYLSILEVSVIDIDGLTSVDPILATLRDLRGVPTMNVVTFARPVLQSCILGS